MSSRSPLVNLVVIRCADIERAATFYRALGLVLTRESHGGPVHYSSQLGDCVFELYPLKPGASSTGVRLGFVVSDVNSILAAVVLHGGKIIESGARVVIEDVEGHRIELTPALEP